MRFYRDSELSTPVEWYFVPDNREVVPYAHAFGSRIYERSEEPQEAIGERYSPVPWRGGAPPPQAPPGGLCGTEQQWADGALVTDPLPEVWPGSTVNRCCHKPPEVANGAVILGGRGIQSACCPGIEIPVVLSVRYTVFSLFCPPLDGIPFALYPSTATCAFITLGDIAYESDVMDFGGTLVKFYLACEPTFVGWILYAVDPTCSVIRWAETNFEEQSCDPFRLFAFTSFWIAPAGSCDILDASVEILPAG